MKNQLKTAPASEPITLADARAYLGIVQAADTGRDAIISTHIAAARTWAEQYCRIAVITQTWELYLDSFSDSITLLGKLQSVTSVKYYDTSDALQTASNTLYYVDTVNSAIVLKDGSAWPTTKTRPNAVVIEYVTGFGNAAAIPEDIKTALKFLVDHWEKNQKKIDGGVITTIPYAVTQLLNTYRDMRGFFEAQVTR